jgi:hypothetical protein
MATRTLSPTGPGGSYGGQPNDTQSLEPVVLREPDTEAVQRIKQVWGVPAACCKGTPASVVVASPIRARQQHASTGSSTMPARCMALPHLCALLGAGRTAEQVSCGFRYTCALTNKAHVYCWGQSLRGGGGTHCAAYASMLGAQQLLMCLRCPAYGACAGAIGLGISQQAGFQNCECTAMIYMLFSIQ